MFMVGFAKLCAQIAPNKRFEFQISPYHINYSHLSQLDVKFYLKLVLCIARENMKKTHYPFDFRIRV